RLGGEGGVDHELAVDGQVGVLEGQRGRVPARLEPGGDRLLPLRGRGGDEELVVEERPAVGSVEEVGVHRVLLGEQPLGQVGGVEAAQHQAAVVAPGDELVHRVRADVGVEDAVVDLELLCVEAVDDVVGPVRGGQELAQVVGLDGQAGGAGHVRVGGRARQRGEGNGQLGDL